MSPLQNILSRMSVEESRLCTLTAEAVIDHIQRVYGLPPAVLALLSDKKPTILLAVVEEVGSSFVAIKQGEAAVARATDRLQLSARKTAEAAALKRQQ